MHCANQFDNRIREHFRNTNCYRNLTVNKIVIEFYINKF